MFLSVVFVLFYVVLSVKPSALHIVCKHFTTEVYSQLQISHVFTLVKIHNKYNNIS